MRGMFENFNLIDKVLVIIKLTKVLPPLKQHRFYTTTVYICNFPPSNIFNTFPLLDFGKLGKAVCRGFLLIAVFSERQQIAALMLFVWLGLFFGFFVFVL